MSKKQIKVGVQRGGGPPPGYEWSIGLLDFVYDEALKFLSEEQYRHLAGQVQELAAQPDATHSTTVRVQKIEDFYEIKDRGGILRNLNVRVFFGIDDTARGIIILGAIQKQNNGPTPAGDRIRMRRRWRKYKNGDYGEFPV